jgi:hypothetical protein
MLQRVSHRNQPLHHLQHPRLWADLTFAGAFVNGACLLTGNPSPARITQIIAEFILARSTIFFI